jgi:hypothetical protein
VVWIEACLVTLLLKPPALSARALWPDVKVTLAHVARSVARKQVPGLAVALDFSARRNVANLAPAIIGIQTVIAVFLKILFNHFFNRHLVLSRAGQRFTQPICLSFHLPIRAQ